MGPCRSLFRTGDYLALMFSVYFGPGIDAYLNSTIKRQIGQLLSELTDLLFLGDIL